MKNDKSAINIQMDADVFFPQPLRLKRIIPPIIIMLISVFLVRFTDKTYIPIYNFLEKLPLDEFFSTTKQLVGFTSIATLLICVWIFDRKRRYALVILLVALGIAALLNECVKQTTGRARPTYSIKMGDKERKEIVKYITEHSGAPLSIENKDFWLLAKKHRPFFKDKYSSFPSGHSNSAFVILLFLVICYPRGKWLWAIFAIGCAFARVRYRRHFPEDILFGASLGWFTANIVFSWYWLANFSKNLIERIDRKLK